MGEDQNIKEENAKEQISDNKDEVNGSISQQTIETTKSELQVSKPPTEEMEVRHPHHVAHKKKWSEYLLEFFMLFLAVFLGFIAENIRENSVERHREHEYLSSLLQDLKEDQKLLESQISRHKNLLAMTDSFIAILNIPALIPKSGNELYYFGRLAPRLGNFYRQYENL